MCALIPGGGGGPLLPEARGRLFCIILRPLIDYGPRSLASLWTTSFPFSTKNDDGETLSLPLLPSERGRPSLTARPFSFDHRRLSLTRTQCFHEIRFRVLEGAGEDGDDDDDGRGEGGGGSGGQHD